MIGDNQSAGLLVLWDRALRRSPNGHVESIRCTETPDQAWELSAALDHPPLLASDGSLAWLLHPHVLLDWRCGVWAPRAAFEVARDLAREAVQLVEYDPEVLELLDAAVAAMTVPQLQELRRNVPSVVGRAWEKGAPQGGAAETVAAVVEVALFGAVELRAALAAATTAGIASGRLWKLLLGVL